MNRVLVITYFWPPASKASMHWQLKIVKHLPEFGWKPTVLTVTDDMFEFRDESLMTEIDPSLEIIKKRPREPFNIYKKFIGKAKNQPLIDSETISKTNAGLKHKLAVWIRMNIFIPDARVGWYKQAVSGASEYLKKNKIDAIFSVGPPHSSHLIGIKLSKKFGVPVIPVLQDPWSDIIYYNEFKRTKVTRLIDKYLEKKTLSLASQIIFVNKTTREDYIKKYPAIKEKSHVLYWGYNEDNFEGVARSRENDDELVIIHSGNIFDFQNPTEFWKNLRLMIDKGIKIKLKFTGTVSPLIKSEIIKNRLTDVTEYLGVLPYRKMLQELCNADVLLVCPTERRHVPGKLFEYLRVGNPILAFNDENDEVSNLLNNSNAGLVLPYNNDAAEFFSKLNSFHPDVNKAKQYERKIIVEKFSEILNKAKINSIKDRL